VTCPSVTGVFCTIHTEHSIVSVLFVAYDTDVNPIGAIAKGDIKRFLLYAAEHYGMPSLARVAHAAPTAELVPSSVDAVSGKEIVQLDEVDSEHAGVRGLHIVFMESRRDSRPSSLQWACRTRNSDGSVAFVKSSAVDLFSCTQSSSLRGRISRLRRCGARTRSGTRSISVLSF
jgi:hypothetical protein